jgi:hypothetical protein
MSRGNSVTTIGYIWIYCFRIAIAARLPSPGDNTHDYKFTAAVFEDCEHDAARWRDRFLASCMYIFCGSADRDNPLVDRARAALKT